MAQSCVLASSVALGSGCLQRVGSRSTKRGYAPSIVARVQQPAQLVKGWGAENSRPGSSLLKCRAGPDDDMSEYDKEGGLLESEAVATGIAVAGVSAVVGAVVVLVYLAYPVINTTIEAFPGAQQAALQQQQQQEQEDD